MNITNFLLCQPHKSDIMDKEVCLTHRGLSLLGFSQDFELKTDIPEDVIKCNRSQISFISPLVSKLLMSDSSISEFTLKTANSSKCSSILRSLLNGNSTTVKKDLIDTFRNISAELGNEELMDCVEDDITLQNVINITKIKHMKCLDIEKEIEFIANNFSNFNVTDFSTLDVSIIDSVLSSDHLVVENEHRLFEFIRGLISEYGEEYSSLLSHLILEYLDKSDISIFIQYIDESNIWSILPCIYRRLLASPTLQISEKDKSRFGIISFGKNKFDGIFAHLRKRVGGNPITMGIVGFEERESGSYRKNGVIYINSLIYQDNIIYQNSSSYRNNPIFPNLIDPEKNVQTDWVCRINKQLIIDFKDKRVSLDGFSLKNPSNEQNGPFIKSLKIEGSHDKDNWIQLYEGKTNSLSTHSAEEHFNCTKSSPYRFFRVIINNDSYFYLHAIEFFGSIF